MLMTGRMVEVEEAKLQQQSHFRSTLILLSPVQEEFTTGRLGFTSTRLDRNVKLQSVLPKFIRPGSLSYRSLSQSTCGILKLDPVCS